MTVNLCAASKYLRDALTTLSSRETSCFFAARCAARSRRTRSSIVSVSICACDCGCDGACAGARGPRGAAPGSDDDDDDDDGDTPPLCCGWWWGRPGDGCDGCCCVCLDLDEEEEEEEEGVEEEGGEEEEEEEEEPEDGGGVDDFEFACGVFVVNRVASATVRGVLRPTTIVADKRYWDPT